MTDIERTVPGVVVMRLDGRGPLNLLGRGSFLALSAELDRVHKDPSARVVILTGSGGRAFSAGVDVHEMKDLDADGAKTFITALHGPARKLLTMAVPAIAAIRGPCLGSWPWPVTSESPPRAQCWGCRRSGSAYRP